MCIRDRTGILDWTSGGCTEHSQKLCIYIVAWVGLGLWVDIMLMYMHLHVYNVHILVIQLQTLFVVL